MLRRIDTNLEERLKEENKGATKTIKINEGNAIAARCFDGA